LLTFSHPEDAVGYLSPTILFTPVSMKKTLVSEVSEEYSVVVYSQEVPSPRKLRFIRFRFSRTSNMLCLNCEDRKKLDTVQFIIWKYI